MQKEGRKKKARPYKKQSKATQHTQGSMYMYIHTCISPSHTGTTATWPLAPPDDPEGWRHIRLKLTGPNASGQTHYMSMSGLELYGEIRGLADEDLGRGRGMEGSCIIHITYCIISADHVTSSQSDPVHLVT